MIRANQEVVNGIIIGGEAVPWKVAYDGREQMTFKRYSDDEATAMADARAYIETLKRENKPIGLYPDDSKWEIRIY